MGVPDIPQRCEGTLRAAAGVITVVDGDVTMLLSATQRERSREPPRYHILDLMGADLWQLLRVGTSFDGLVSRLSERSATAEATAQRDVLGFLSELRALGLIECREPDTP